MLQVHTEDSIALLILDHEDRGNSFGSNEAAVLAKTLKNKSLRGLILTGIGTRFFCTGGNLSEQAATGAQKAFAAQGRVREALQALQKWPHPTVALVNGDCFGGGTELVSAFDLVLATPHALFGFWQRKLGLTYGWGGGARLLRRLTPQALATRALETRLMTASEAR
ncbi:MAG TPA: enoyl-CoA hydratase/isomerase family protein, partial [Bdellovibrionales bacterium]|nr:enoyl-CoA hydratase/isomerase family protein [Bdellovibrionales bacterium]